MNVFEFLSEDAIRRKRDQELLEATLNQHRSNVNLISENSAKIICKRIISDFNNAIVQVSQIYQMEDNDCYEMSEEQFASIFASLGLFRDLGTE